MARNVAIFVDVANVFYAAKAAGVDIDYVTLLKTLTANRDLVRAYAYTGLDPENENQKAFHNFLARNNYKVVSKDVRKYGDGRFKANLDIADVVLPISPFTETAGTFVNAEGRAQSFHGVVRPLGETRPGWKVLRVLGHMLGLSGFEQETIEEVRRAALPTDIASRLSNATQAPIDASPIEHQPVSASIYQLDGIVRRAPSLQLTADARGA